MNVWHWRVLLVAVAAAVAAGGAQAQLTVFTGAQTDDYSNAGNWTVAVPTSADTAQWGTPAYSGVGSTIYTGTAGEAASVEIGAGATGLLTVQAGASLTSSGAVLVGADLTVSGEPTAASGTLTVDGTVSGSEVSIGGNGVASLTINAGGTVSASVGVFLSQNADLPWGGEYGYDTEVYINGGLLQSGDKFFMDTPNPDPNTIPDHSMYLLMDGGTISTIGATFVCGGTFEVKGQSVFEITNSSIRMRSWTPGNMTFKFSGTDPLLTILGNVGWSEHVMYVDVGDLTLSTPGEWTTVLDNTGTVFDMDGFLELAPGTGPEWDLQVDPNNDLQLKYESPAIMGDVNLSTCVDDDDLSLLLANWSTGDEWGEGDLNDDQTVNDDDLSLLLANWGAGCTPAPEGVPEPTSLVLLAIGSAGVLMRRKR